MGNPKCSMIQGLFMPCNQQPRREGGGEGEEIEGLKNKMRTTLKIGEEKQERNGKRRV